MGISSTRRVGEDIYGFLDFLSPRQGPNESTNPKPPEPPPQQEASAAPGPLPGAGMSQPGSMSDADPLLPFAPPKPDSSKPVQLAAAGGGGGSAAAPPAVAPIKPPGPAPEVPEALTSDKGTKPGTGITKGEPVFGGDPNAKVPLFDPSSGKLDVIGILEAQQQAARKRQALENIIGGGMNLAAGITGDKSLRTSVQAGGGGAGGDITAASLMAMDKTSREEAAAAYKQKITPLIAQRLRIPPELVQLLDNDKLGTITTALVKGENLKEVKREDGSSMWVRPDGSQAFSISPDELSVRKASDTHAAALDTRLAARDTHLAAIDTRYEKETALKSAKEDLQKKIDEGRQRDIADDEASVRAQADMAGEPYDQFSKLPREERLRRVGAQSDTQKELRAINQGRPADSPMTMEELLDKKRRDKVQEEQIKAGFGPAVTDIFTTNRKIDDSNALLDQQDIERQYSLSALRSGRAIVGSPLSPKLMDIKKTIQNASHREDTDIDDTELIAIETAKDVLTRSASKQLPGQLSNMDLQFLREVSASSSKLNAETMRRVINIARWASRAERDRFNTDISKRNDQMPAGIPRTTGTRDQMPVDTDMYRYLSNDHLTQLFGDKKGGMQVFDRSHGGNGIAGQVVQDIDQVIQSKMQTRGMVRGTFSDKPVQSNVHDVDDVSMFNAVKNMNLEQLESQRALYEKKFEADYGSQGRGLYDAILAAKKAGKFGDM